MAWRVAWRVAWVGRGAPGLQPTHQRINLPRDPGSLDPRQPPGLGGPGSPRVWGPKCVGASLSSGDASGLDGFATESRETGSRDQGARLAAKTWLAAAGAPGSSRVPGSQMRWCFTKFGDASGLGFATESLDWVARLGRWTGLAVKT